MMLVVGRERDSAEAQPVAQSCVHQLSEHEVEDSLLAELALPTPAVDTVELEDARWFHLTWLERQLSNSGISHAFLAPFVHCDRVVVGVKVSSAGTGFLGPKFSAHIAMVGLYSGSSESY